MSNRLAQSSSPYLQQHRNNPVNWLPWGDEALQKAKAENKPIFLSIGYSSCHWCHVMERESFSDVQIAEVLNSHYVPIKVDREERPDIDHLYMKAVLMLTGSGGWPLNVFLTPDLKPFYGGTYFPPDARYGRPPFREVLLRLADIFQSQSSEVRRNADQLTAHIIQQSQFFQPKAEVDPALLGRILVNLTNQVDDKWGGLGSAPKFFYTDGWRLLLRSALERKDEASLKSVETTLDALAHGGIFDQVGGGFHRYSTDAEWRVPHFEKMLYDNALLMRLFLDGWKATQKDLYREIVEETATWVLREMTDAEGGFYSAIDADSEHEEGLFYTWTWDELRSAVSPEDLLRWKSFLEISPEGNFEGRNIFHFSARPSSAERKKLKAEWQSLLKIRNQREWPLIDRKIQVSWNGLMISSLAFAGFSLERADWIAAAEQAAERIWKVARKDTSLRHSFLGDNVNSESFLEDYAYFSEALLDLFAVTGNEKYFLRAHELADEMEAFFFDREAGGFWSTRSAQADLLCRFKEIHDGALPAPYHLALSVFQRLHSLTALSRDEDVFSRSLKAIVGNIEESPGGFNRLALVLADFFEGSPAVVVGKVPEKEIEALRKNYLPWPFYFLSASKNSQFQTETFAEKAQAPQFSLCRSGACEFFSDLKGMASSKEASR